MYNWRTMTPAMRAEVLRLRLQQGCPWHGPPHGFEKHWHHISAACYEHKPVIGTSPERMATFEKDIFHVLGPVCEGVSAWCILPNHYHLLLQCIHPIAVRKALGQLHGRTSRSWNIEDTASKRTCWHRCLMKPVTSDAHRWVTLNYIHHNPVHHGYVECWQAWPFSSAKPYLDAVGHDFAEQIWKKYPLLDFGRGWDDADV